MTGRTKELFTVVSRVPRTQYIPSSFNSWISDTNFTTRMISSLKDFEEEEPNRVDSNERSYLWPVLFSTRLPILEIVFICHMLAICGYRFLIIQSDSRRHTRRNVVGGVVQQLLRLLVTETYAKTMSFYVTLLSNASMTLFIYSNPSLLFIKLPQTIEVNHLYKVGLPEIQFPNCLLMSSKSKFEFITIYRRPKKTENAKVNQ